MNYTVLWQPGAERDLLEIWLSTRFRQQVTDVANRFDEVLRRDPHEVGESRDDNLRFAFEFPLAIDFEVVDSDLLVRVLAVREYPRR